MTAQLQNLPIGIQSFEKLRREGYLYVDKTARLMNLVNTGAWYFLSRPRRFGKSLTVSTLDAMFSGKVELFSGLAAEEWVREQAKHPAPVLRLSMASLDNTDAGEFNLALNEALFLYAKKAGLKLETTKPGSRLLEIVQSLYAQSGPAVVLIDEYDKPILDHIGDLNKAEELRLALRNFYAVLKDCDDYLHFVFLTGISKFSKTGVFSAMNNVQDISRLERYGDIVGYTQEELENNFATWIDTVSANMQLSRDDLLERIKYYYDGFSFDGRNKLYNPFSVLNFFSSSELSNFWYTSGSPSFIVAYMKRHNILDPEHYRHIQVKADFADSQEIERAKPESFLFQSGYLTIEEKTGQSLLLDYPNQEVLDSIASMYLEYVYKVDGYDKLGSELWTSLQRGDIQDVVRRYNSALAAIPYWDFHGVDEGQYRSWFLMFLRGAGVRLGGEMATYKGRSDLVALFPERVVVLEFKLAENAGAVERLRAEGFRQIEEKGYARPFEDTGCTVIKEVIVVDAKKRQAV